MTEWRIKSILPSNLRQSSGDGAKKTSEKSKDSLSALSNVAHSASTMDTRVNMAPADKAGEQSINNLRLQPFIKVYFGWCRFSVQNKERSKSTVKVKEKRIHRRSLVEVSPLIFCFHVIHQLIRERGAAVAFLQDAAADADATSDFDWQPDPPLQVPRCHFAQKDVDQFI